MPRTLLLILLSSLLLFCFGRNEQVDPGSLNNRYLAAEKLFQDASQLSRVDQNDDSVQAKADRLYLKALSSFSSLVPTVASEKKDSLHFFIMRRIGYIEYLFDSLKSARQDFATAIRLKAQLPAIPDSFLFTPLLYSGSIFYSMNEYDSALNYYKRAEQVAGEYGNRVADVERLFNRLGVMYYETGNYREARNYFEKAIAVTPPSSTQLISNYNINIASLLVKLDELDKAKELYEKILPSGQFTNEIHHNLGIIAIKQKDYLKAIRHFQQVNYDHEKKNIELQYNLAMAMDGLGQKDSAETYLLKAKAENLKWNGHRRNTSYGLILKLEGEQLVRQGLIKEALPLLQEAVMQFAPGFADTALGSNPASFTEVHSYINLFNTLSSKADALELLYNRNQFTGDLEKSLLAYKSAFALADFVEKTYNSDEARMFLGKVKYSVHNKPIETGLRLYRLTNKREFLEDVYLFDQQNKASVLSLNLWEKQLRSANPAMNALYLKESSLRSAITRNSIKASGNNDSATLASINAIIRDQEIELNKIQDVIKADPTRPPAATSIQIPSINELQRRLDNNTALLSYHLSNNGILILVITANQFSYRESKIDSGFFQYITEYKRSLYTTVSGQRYEGNIAAAKLYDLLIGNVYKDINQAKRLVIIPDDELNYLPFEALQDGNKNYLVQLYAIQYQYATSLVFNEHKSQHSSITLAFAPFAHSGFRDSGATNLDSLPSSIEETNDKRGRILIDSFATKKNFLALSGHYGVIHLATHAAANNADPLNSYIAFYPGNDDYKLYAREIYDLHLDSARLVILSACETGTGQLVKGEGLMSLSRAFAYAGCPSIIASLWKAEDKTTAYLIQRLHFYLGKNLTKDEALQKAKLDLLQAPEIDARFKTPNYWAHLILIGEYEPDHKRSNWPWVAFGIIGILLAYYLIKGRSPAAIKRRRA